MEFLVFILIGGVIGLIIRALMNAGKSNLPKELMYNCNQTALIAAIKKTAEKINYTIESVDTISGRIRLGIGMSMTSFGEWMDIQLMEIAPEKTKLIISCRAKKGREIISKNNKNIDSFLDTLSSTLSK